jgi:sporulation protein YlmC with PRC-barrel domain
MNHQGKNAGNEDNEAGHASRTGPGPNLMGADTLIGNDVYNLAGDDLGVIKELMLDMRSGRIIYAVLSFKSFLGLGEKLFAVPWRALTRDTEHKRFMLDVDRHQLTGAPGFDKSHWPDMADQRWQMQISRFYGRTGWE